MRYVLFVGENCHDCQKVNKTIVEMGFDIPQKNIDKGDKPPIDIYIFPALLSEDGNLMAYGLDIVEFLKNPINKAPKLSFIKKILRMISAPRI